MDASEWETMKKNEKLLEEAVAREKELGAKVESLQKDKIDALKANEKMVTIVKRVNVAESLMCSVSTHDIVQRLAGMMANVANNHNDKYGRGNHISISHMEHAFHTRNPSIYMNDEIHHIKSLFYTEKHELRMDDDQETITHKGLDQVKADIAKDYEESMSKKHKETIQSNKDLIKDSDALKKEIKDLKLMLKNDRRIIDDLELDVKSLSKENNLLKEKYACFIDKDFVSLTRDILSDTRGFVTNGKRLKELDKLWKKKD